MKNLKKLTDLKTRGITGTLFISIVILALYFGAATAIPLFTLIIAIGIYEFYQLASKLNTNPQKFGIILGIASFLLVSAVTALQLDNIWFLTLISIGIAPYIIELYRKTNTAFANIAYTISGIFYMVFPFTFLLLLAYSTDGNNYNFHIPLAFFFLLWANDTGAYLVGVSIGKHRLFERLSPKKSWEGFFGGVIITAIIAWVISNFYTDFNVLHWIIIGVIISIFATLGDLSESLIKRNADVKDSGSILPGHGGILDRFDGVTLSAPLVYIYVHLFI